MRPPTDYARLAEPERHYFMVCDALGVRQGESLMMAADRVMASPHGNRAWRVASIIRQHRDQTGPEAHKTIRRAAKVAARLLRGGA